MKQRIIKFRVWDKILKTFLNEDEFELQVPTDKKNSCAFILVAKDINKKELSIEQFTGLLDKNGKEIFEGDIVRGLLNPEYENFIVTFDNGCFSVKRPKVDGFIAIFDVIEMKVIGNVHENSELVK